MGRWMGCWGDWSKPLKGLFCCKRSITRTSYAIVRLRFANRTYGPDAQAKQFVAPKDAANLYIYRNETFGAAIKMPLLVDGMAVGDTVAHSYILKQVTPGSHTITSKSENDATLTLSTEAGKNYYVWQEVKMGLLMARSKLSQVSEEEGKQGVMESKLVK